MLLTFNRPEHVRKRAAELAALPTSVIEIFIVDNHSEIPAESVIDVADPRIRIIRTERNRGAVARNLAFREAAADVIVALDDDVFGLDAHGIAGIAAAMQDPKVGAVNFRIADPQTGRPMNWCHHYDVDTHWAKHFVTNEMSEGAVAIRRHCLLEVGLYPESFFISHEGPDLAFRLLNHGYAVIYNPDVLVCHEPAEQGRASWRRYYFDTRNVFWLAARNFPFWYGARKIFVQTGALFVYAVRDRHVWHWLRGMVHGMTGLGLALSQRQRPKPSTMRLVHEIEANRPPLAKQLRRRVFRRGVQI